MTLLISYKMRNVPFSEYLQWSKNTTKQDVGNALYGAVIVFVHVLAIIIPMCIPLIIYKLL